MAVTNSWPGVNGLTTSLDARKALAGLIETDTTGAARPGIFPAGLTSLVSARSDLNVDIAAFQACAVQFGGPVLYTNDAVAQLPSPLVSPTSGTNYYVVYSKINESVSPGTDANNNRVLGTVLSTTSFTLARSGGARMDGSGTGLPAGANELATVQMPSGKTATNASGVVITPTFQFTATEGGTVLLRNQADQDAWAPNDGAEAYRLDLAAKMRRVGGVWYRVAYTQTARLTPGGTGLTASTMTTVASLTLPADAPPGTYLVMYTVTTAAASAVAHYQLVQWAGVEITASPSDYMNAVPVGDASKSDTITKLGHPGGTATIDLRVQVNGSSASCRFARLTVLFVG